MEQLNKTISKIHNYIYANEGLSNSETLNEFLKIFYCKILDENNGNQLRLACTNTEILSIIECLYQNLLIKLEGIIDKNEKITLRDETLLYIINELNEISLTNISADIKGHILQRIIDRSYRESRGQFFTPAPVVDFIVKMINPQYGEYGCDPACGTGGFLFSALNYISQNKPIDNIQLNKIHFYDISKSLIKLVAMRMMFEFSDYNVHYEVKDSIRDEFNFKYDYILTNPPFGTQGKISDKKILSKYILGTDISGKTIKSQVPDILFVEKVIKILKDGGRAAIILPDGNFENPSLEYFRKFLVNNVKINAIISLPDGTFIPYGTGVKSSILFISKEKTTENYDVFYGKITKLGYSFSKHSKTELLANGTINEDYSQIINAFYNKKYSDFAYLVNISEIQKNNYIMSESFYSPIYKRTIDSIKQGNYALLKELVEFNYKKIKIDKESQYNYVEISDVNAYSSEIINSNIMYGEELPSRASYLLQKDNIIVATSGNSIGTIKQAKAFVTERYEGSICTNGFTVMKATNISKYYLLYFFNSKEFLNQMLKYKYGTAIPCIGRNDFENILVPIPNNEELTIIVDRIKKAIHLREEAFQLMNM
ncbi:MAG: N-6 DNA methylase [Lachnospiraceae bacterium]|nr:N-6 DNA methylase [Lachnospiraceae bacterium]